MDTFPLRPREVFEELSKTVVGQDEAIRELSVAIVKHLVGHPAPNILMIGNSGSGKTTLMRAVEQFLGSRPDLSRSVEHGIVFIDEVDKIRAQVSGDPNVRGIVAQEALLTLMENENVEFEMNGMSFAVNSSSVLFIVGGAFEELYEAVFRRATIGQDVAPMKPIVVVSASGEVREELPFHLRDYLKYEDLFRYGMTPQFISRFESIVVLNDLAESDLARIFVEPEASIFRTSRAYFQRFGIDLQIPRGALIAIAWDAARQKRLGARALRKTFRRVIGRLEFDPTDAGSHVITVDEAMVKQTIAGREQGTPRPR